MFPVMYDEEQHQILESEVGRWCVRNAPVDWRDRLFTYRHKRHGTFVVAVWARDKYGLMSDVVNLGYGWGGFNKAMADELMRRMWAPMSPETMARRIDQSSRDYESIQQDKQGQIKEANEKRRRFWNK
jgi:hypothetical protein